MAAPRRLHARDPRPKPFSGVKPLPRPAITPKPAEIIIIIITIKKTRRETKAWGWWGLKNYMDEVAKKKPDSTEEEIMEMISSQCGVPGISSYLR